MKTFGRFPEKFFNQKGQGLVEYALLVSFVGAIAVFVMLNGGFRYSTESLFGGASDSLNEAGATSFDYETLTAEDVSPTKYPTLNWPEVHMSAQAMYGTVMRSDTVDKAIKSETNLFNDLSSHVEGHLASEKEEDGTKDWDNFLSMMESSQAAKNFQSSYKRGEETFTIQRMGNSNAVRATYSDGKEAIYYQLSPDSNNVMQIETNSNKSFNEFMKPIINKGGWEYNK